MGNSTIKPCIILIGLFLFYIFLGCAARPKVPIFADPDLHNMKFESLTILPVVDRRVDKSYNLDFESTIGNRVEKKLVDKGYTVIRPGAFSDTIQVSNLEVAEMEPHELKALGEENTNYMFVVYLDDVSSKTALGYSFKIECTALLVNKQTGAMLWKDKGIGTRGQGGLIGCLQSPMVKTEAINICVGSMLSSFPDNPTKAD
ncbi:MAG: hypothetical protein JXA91_01915 [Candidatus Thermoplasmatota archaeon]|nr:hypothetical protein [Candidatus Thermoplasmatota archaeon]